MIRHLVKMLTITLAVVLVVATLALAAGPIMGTVAAIDKLTPCGRTMALA